MGDFFCPDFKRAFQEQEPKDFHTFHNIQISLELIIMESSESNQQEEIKGICYDCLRPLKSCYCKYTAPVESGIKFVILMHPKEAKHQRTGTGRLAHLCLPESEIKMGIDFTHNKRLNDLLKDPQYFPVMLYPGPDAWNVNREGFAEKLTGKKLLVIIIDSTWFCSKKMIRLSTNVNTLPKFSFANLYKSIFTFKEEPEEYCISTIESCYYLIKEMQGKGLSPKEADPEPLMNVFKAMIKYQLEMENKRVLGLIPNSHAKDHKYTKLKNIPEFLQKYTPKEFEEKK